MHKLKIYTIPFLFLIFSFSSCITSRKINYLQKPDFIIPSYKDSTSYEDYRLKPGDRLYVKIYSTDDKTNILFNGSQQTSQMALAGGGESPMMDLYTYLVLNDGNVIFPMIGKVNLQRLTVREATSKLEKEISPYYKFSTVEIKIVARYFSVIGGGRAGYFPIPREKINIFQALAMAGNIDVYGDRSRLKIIRETENGTEVKMFDVRSKDIIHSEFYYVEPNDVIYIQSVDEQFYSVTNLTSLFSIVLSTISFGTIIFTTLFNLE